MTTRIRIDLYQGIVEAEGTESFVRAIYEEFKSSLSEKIPHKKTESKTSRRRIRPAKVLSKSAKAESKPKKKARRESPKMISDLDLSGSRKTPSLRDFFGIYKAKSNFDRNLIFIYYLKNKLKLDPVTIDHVFTCYRNIHSLKIPGNLEQSLIDMKMHKGWIDTSSLEDIKLNIHGINHIEHDMEHAEATADA